MRGRGRRSKLAGSTQAGSLQLCIRICRRGPDVAHGGLGALGGAPRRLAPLHHALARLDLLHHLPLAKLFQGVAGCEIAAPCLLAQLLGGVHLVQVGAARLCCRLRFHGPLFGLGLARPTGRRPPLLLLPSRCMNGRVVTRADSGIAGVWQVQESPGVEQVRRRALQGCFFRLRAGELYPRRYIPLPPATSSRRLRSSSDSTVEVLNGLWWW